MRTLRLFVCLLVSAPLLILGGCKKTDKALVCDVTMNACTASPYDIRVKEGTKVCWEAVDHDYTISFSDRNEPTANPFKVNHGASSPGHVIKGKKGCEPIPNQPGHFYCKYSLTKDNDPSPCADPGIHIVP